MSRATTKRAVRNAGKRTLFVTAGKPQQAKKMRRSIATLHWETQADRMADAFTSGKQDLKRFLTPAPAAFREAGASVGYSLPGPLQARFEQAFGATLGAVRIHTGAPAAEVARREGAAAFTAGRNIFFRDGFWNPNTLSGLRLLAHEISHVLQQTGRASSDGLLEVRDIAGTGEVQRKDYPRPAPERIDTDELAKKYAAQLPDADKPKFQELARDISLHVGSVLSADNRNAQYLVDHVNKGEWDKPPRDSKFRPFVCDVLRVCGKHEAAAHLLALDPVMPSLFHSEETANQAKMLLKESWVDTQLAQDPLKEYFPFQYVDTYRRYLFGPTRELQSLIASPEDVFGEYPKFARSYLEGQKKMDEPGANELFMDAMDRLLDIDERRLRGLDILRGALLKKVPSMTPGVLRRDIARGLVKGFVPEGGLMDSPALRQVSAEIVALAKTAVAFWDLALSGEGGAERRKALEKVAQGKEGAKLRKELSAVAELLLARTKNGKLPPAAEYQARIQKVQKRLRQFAYNEAEQRVIQMARGKWDAGLGFWYGLVFTAIADIQDALATYNFAQDRHFPEGYPDVRIAHRIRFARKLEDFAVRFQWNDLKKFVSLVEQGKEPGLKHNQIAILGDWHLDESTPASDFKDPLKGVGSIEGLGGLTPSNLINLFSMEYYGRFTEEILKILEGPKDKSKPGEEGRFDERRDLVLNRAHDALKQGPRKFQGLERYIVYYQDFELTLGAGPESVYDLIADHPKTTSKLQQIDAALEITENRSWALILLERPETGRPLFFWTVPPLKLLYERLRKIRVGNLSLDDIVNAEMRRAAPPRAAEAGPQPPPSPPEADWVTWLKTFTKLPPDQLKGFLAETTRQLAAGAQSAILQYEQAARRASIQDRKLLVKFGLRRLLETFDSTSSTSDQPMKAYEDLIGFASNSVPFRDHEKHWAVMVLELFQPPANDEKDLVLIFKKYAKGYHVVIAWQALLRWTARQATDPKAAIEDVFTADEKKDPNWIKATLPRLDEVIKAMEKHKKEAQLKFGMLAEPAGEERRDTTLDRLMGRRLGKVVLGPETVRHEDRVMDYNYHHEIAKNHPPFTINGVSWMLLEVFHAFEYHGPYGSIFEPDSYTPSILIVDGRDVPVDAKTLQRTSTRELLQVKRAGQVITIRENDDALLDELSDAVTLRGDVEDLETLEKVLNKGAELILEGAEFVPGAGQALMATRLAVAIIQFIGGNEFAEIKEKVFKDPRGTLETLAGLIKGDLFSVEKIADWFLLGNMASFPEALTQEKKPEPEPQSESTSIASKFLHLIKRIALAGAGIYRSLKRVQKRASRGYLELDAFIHTRPALLLAFTIAGNHLELLLAAAKEIHERGLDIDEMKGEFPGFSDALGDIVQAINTIEIPDSILPIEDVLNIIIDVIIDQLGGKFKWIGKGVLVFLDKFGQKQKVLDAIGKRVPDEIQPDHYWQKFAKQALDPPFHEFRKGIVDGITYVFVHYLGLPEVEANKVPNIDIKQRGTEFPASEDIAPSAGGNSPAVQKKAAEDPDPDLWDGPLPAPGPGSPLPLTLRGRMESEFGHDFSHVRLHTGDEAKPVTGRFQADGVTTGSHVYMRPGLQPDTGRGRQVFRHELSHVLQQTGSRPLGGKHSETPKTGEPQQGLRWDPAAETAADRMAEPAENSAAPVEVEAADCQAAQPLLSAGTVARLLRKLSRGEAVAEQRKRLTEGPLRQLPDAVQKQIASVQSSILACFSQKPLFRMPGTFEEVRTQISAYAAYQLSGKDKGQEIQRAAQEALDHPTASEAETGEKPEPTLNVQAFRAALESMLYNLGLVCRIQVKTQSAQGKTTTLDSTNPILNIALATLDMPSIRYAQGDAKELWDTMMSQTFQKLKGDELADLRVRVRTYLVGEGPVFGLWNRKKFALSEHVIKDIEKLAKEKLAAKDLPSRTNYLADKPAAGATVSPTGWIGLNTGTFDAPEFRSRAAEKPGGPLRRPVEREAHHTTQFLLLKYFRNWRDDDYKPFRHPYKLYPGLDTDSMGPKWFDGPKRIEIAKLTGLSKSARGPGMPAISLAKITHRRGDVHISAQADETDEAEPQAKSAAALLHAQFMNGIPGKLHEAMFDAQPNRLQDFMKSQTNQAEAQKHIFSAMQGTYEWMRNDMMERLKRGLKLFELPYYNGLLAKGGEETADANKLTDSDIDNKVMPQAMENNKKIMETNSNWSG